jgi:hypothetical protein
MATPVAYVYNGQPTASNTTLIAAPSAGNTKVFANLVAVNATGGAVTLTLKVVRAVSGVTEPICTALSLPTLSAVSLLDDPRLAMEEVVLDAGDTLQGQASAATSITVTAF